MAVNAVRKRYLEDGEEPATKRQKISSDTYQNANISTKIKEAPSLLELYGIKSNPDFTKNPVQFFQLRDQLNLLESYLATAPNEDDLVILRCYLSQIVNNELSTHEEKMSELGAILFFIDRDKKLPQLTESSYLTTYCQEIKRGIEAISKAHPFKGERIPSGREDYFLAEAGALLLTSEQRLNIGGVYVIFHLLDAHDDSIAGSFPLEHQDHIIRVLHQLLTSQVIALVEKKLSIHEDMKELVRLDLKLAPDAPVDSLGAMRAALTALLFDLRQKNMSNCYAVASLIYGTQNYLYKILSQLTGWMQTGQFVVKDQPEAFSIIQIFEHRLLQETDLSSKLNTFDVVSIFPFRIIFQAFGLEMSVTQNLPENRDTSVSLILKTIFSNSHLEKNQRYAEKLFLAFKHRMLLLMMLSLAEFHVVNYSSSSEFTYSTQKREMINTLIQPILRHLSESFSTTLKQKIEKRLWIIDDNDTMLLNAETREQKIPAFEGDSEELSELLEDVPRRVFHLKDQKLCKIETISQIKKIVGEWIQETGNEVVAPEMMTLFAGKLLENNFYSENIAQFCAARIKKAGIQSSHLLKADLLIFPQDGGSTEKLLNHLFKINVSYTHYNNKTPTAALNTLWSLSTSPGISVLHSTLQCNVMNANSHGYMIDPKAMRKAFGQHASYQEFIDHTIYHPIEKLLKRPFPIEIAKNIEQRCKLVSGGGNNFQMLSEEELNDPNGLTYASFCDLFLMKNQRSSLFTLFKKILHEEYSKIQITSELIDEILQKLQITIPENTLQLFKSNLQKKFKMRTFPFILAKFFSVKLIEHKQFLSPNEIEKVICDINDLPHGFDIGDNLYTNHYSSDHGRLVLRYHFGEEKLCYMEQDTETEILEDANLYNDFYLL